MKSVHAIWKDGRIVPTQPIDWPDGTDVCVEPLDRPSTIESEESLTGDDPASVSRWMAYFDALPPLRMSDAEEAEWQVARVQMKDYTLTRMRQWSVEEQP